MMVTRGKEFVFLGMHISYKENGSETINMKEYVEEAIAEFSEEEKIIKRATELYQKIILRSRKRLERKSPHYK